MTLHCSPLPPPQHLHTDSSGGGGRLLDMVDAVCAHLQAFAAEGAERAARGTTHGSREGSSRLALMYRRAERAQLAAVQRATEFRLAAEPILAAYQSLRATATQAVWGGVSMHRAPAAGGAVAEARLRRTLWHLTDRYAPGFLAPPSPPASAPQARTGGASSTAAVSPTHGSCTLCGAVASAARGICDDCNATVYEQSLNTSYHAHHTIGGTSGAPPPALPAARGGGHASPASTPPSSSAEEGGAAAGGRLSSDVVVEIVRPKSLGGRQPGRGGRRNAPRAAGIGRGHPVCSRRDARDRRTRPAPPLPARGRRRRAWPGCLSAASGGRRRGVNRHRHEFRGVPAARAIQAGARGRAGVRWKGGGSHNLMRRMKPVRGAPGAARVCAARTGLRCGGPAPAG